MNTIDIENLYNLNLNMGGNTYHNLYDYFKKAIEKDSIIIRTDYTNMCCHTTDIKYIKEEFLDKLKNIVEFEDKTPCKDPYKIGCRSY